MCLSFDTSPKTSMVERISIRMEKANRWKGKNIRMPKKEVSYCS